jgi:hypothetical protein
VKVNSKSRWADEENSDCRALGKKNYEKLGSFWLRKAIKVKFY